MKKKIISLYASIFALLFLILFSADYYYKKFVVNYKVESFYTVSALQIFDMKEDSIEMLLDDVLVGAQYVDKVTRDKIYRWRNLQIETSLNSFNNARSLLKFDLITTNYLEPKELEKKLNERYFSSINNMITDLEKNKELFDFKFIEADYVKNRKITISDTYERLVTSEFFKKYPPSQCDGNKEFCLKIYSKYYKYVLEQISLDFKKTNLINFLNIKQDEQISVSNILQDFYSNMFLFDIDFLYFDEKNNIMSEDKLLFLAKKFNDLLNSSFFDNYILFPDSYCRSYRPGCLQSLSDYFNTLLYKFKLDKDNSFKVLTKEVQINNQTGAIKEIPKIAGLSAVLTYILFNLTNRFFRKKLK